MIRKFFILMMVFFLFGCGKKEEPVAEEEIEYISPVRDVFIYSKLDSATQYRINKANGNKEYKNYQMEMLFKDVYDKDLTDINGNVINFKDYDRLIVDVVSVNCSHCKKQVESIDIMSRDLDATFVQYFNEGSKQEIMEFYGEIDIPENLIIIERDEDLKDYFLYELGLKKYPSILTYYDGKVSFMSDGEIDIITYRNILDIGLNDCLSRDDFLDRDGNDLLSINRTMDDVKNDLSIENQNKIKQLDNDGYTEELTYTSMSNTIDFESISNKKSSVYCNEIDDFTVYKDKQLVLIYTFLRDNSQVDRVEFINELIEDNQDLDFIVVLIEGMESSSAALNNMKIRFSCPVVSILGYIPDDFFRFGISSYPTALFVDKGTITGGYSNILNKETFKKATTIFLGEDCVAYKKNNQTNG